MIFYSYANKSHYHKKGCALGLISNVRVFGTRKWPIVSVIAHPQNLVLRISPLSGNEVGFCLVTLCCRFKILMLLSCSQLEVKAKLTVTSSCTVLWGWATNAFTSRSGHFMIGRGRSLWIHRTYLNNVLVSTLFSNSVKFTFVCLFVCLCFLLFFFSSQCFTWFSRRTHLTLCQNCILKTSMDAFWFLVLYRSILLWYTQCSEYYYARCDWLLSMTCYK